MEREIHEQPNQHADDRSERHRMLIGPVREEPRHARSENTERHHEKQWPHRGTVALDAKWALIVVSRPPHDLRVPKHAHPFVRKPCP
jgi:hypothetical protein